MVDLSRMSTEQENPNTTELSSMSVREAIEVINRENYNAVSCIESQYEMMERVIEITSQVLEQGGRIIYMGAGTSGRIGLLDAVECPPTFGVDYNTVIGLIAGGDNVKAYLLAALYNAPATMYSYYRAEVNHDMYGT